MLPRLVDIFKSMKVPCKVCPFRRTRAGWLPHAHWVS